MIRIDAPSNPRVVALAREIARGTAMALEGPRLLSEALDAGLTPETVFYESGPENEAVVSRATEKGAEAILVSSRVLQKLSDLPSARGLVAIAQRPSGELRLLPRAANGLTLLLDVVQDPVNVGAILRSAEAFGVESLLLLRGTASPFSTRALRASAGSALRLPIATDLEFEDALVWIRAEGAHLVGADPHAGEPPGALASLRPLVLAIGSEGHGFSAPLAAALERRVTIPLGGRVESLNAGAATAVLLYALGRP